MEKVLESMYLIILILSVNHGQPLNLFVVACDNSVRENLFMSDTIHMDDGNVTFPSTFTG